MAKGKKAQAQLDKRQKGFDAGNKSQGYKKPGSMSGRK